MKSHFFICALCLALLSPCLKGEDISISAHCTPNPLAAKSMGAYTIVIKGSSQVSPPVFPAIPGVDIQFLGKGHSVQIINGQKRSELRLNYAIKAHTPGVYTLPSLNVQVDHKAYALPPLDLTVLPGSEHALLKQSGISLCLKLEPSTLEPSTLEPSTLEPSTLYLRQTFTCEVVLRVPAGLQGSILSDRPELVSTGFIDCNEPLAPKDSQIQDNGQIFQEISWKRHIQCTQPGVHTLSYQLPLSLRVQSNKNALHSLFDEKFLDPLALFQSQDEEVLLETQELNITVLDLPQEGRPSSFSGYIGTLSAQTVQTSLMDPEVGDPVTIKLILTGSGDLKSLTPPALPQDKRIKTYPPKEDLIHPAPDDERHHKILEYILIPQEAGRLSLPALEIHFFNPDTQRYERLSCAIPPLTVQAPKMPYQAPLKAKANVEDLPQTPKENASLGEGQPPFPTPTLQTHLGTLRPSALPSLWHSRLYWISQGALLLLLIGVLAVRKLSQLGKQKALRQEGLKELDILLQNAKEAAIHKQEAEFFKHLHTILCLPCLYLSHGQGPSLQSLEDFLIERAAPPEALSKARQLWDLRESYTFGGGLGETFQLKALYSDVVTFANHLKPCLTSDL